MNIFAQITKKGLSFKTDRGLVSVQDVWQMPLTGNNGFNLDTLSRDLLKSVRSVEEESLVTTTKKTNSDDELRLEVLKFIVDTKTSEIEEAKQSVILKQKREKLQQKIAEKQDEVDNEKSLEELQQELLDLEK